jgi:hypothetical protein
MIIHNLLTDRKPYTRTAVLILGMQALENLKYLFTIGRRKADTVIRKGNMVIKRFRNGGLAGDGAAANNIRLDADMGRLRFPGVFERIIDETGRLSPAAPAARRIQSLRSFLR